ncbi:MAG: hypothetical protein IAE65_08645 [Ignavibacteria bacterium]|nr:hypothetical protein [Ignavibacteria bacterium]
MNTDFFEIKYNEAEVLEALNYFSNKEWEMAAKSFEKSLTEHSIDVINFVRLLNCYQNLNDTEKFNLSFKKFRKNGFGIKFYKAMCELI